MKLFECFPELIGSKFGVVQKLEHVQANLHIPSFYHYYAYMSNTRAFCEQNNVRYGRGVGVTQQRAMLKAVGEGIERYCSAIYHKKDLLLSSFEEISDPALSPLKTNLYSRDFYSKHPNFKKFTNSTCIRWGKALDLQNNIETYIPATMIYLPYMIDENEAKIFQNISTGLACHSSYEEAVIGAICEVLERDAFMIHWRAKLAPPSIDLSSLPMSILNVIQGYHELGFNIKLFNITTDINVPVVLAMMESSTVGRPALVLSGACNISVDAAILSAIEELELAREHATYLHGSTRSQGRMLFKEVKTQKGHAMFWKDKSNLRLIEFLKKSNETITYKKFIEMNIDFNENPLKILIDRVSLCGIKIFIADLTTDDVLKMGIHVVRAILPEAHPLSFGYGYEQFECSRLFSVPAFFGIAPNLTGKFNKVPHPFP